VPTARLNEGVEVRMIAKVVRKGNLKDFSEVKANLVYWLSKTSDERVSAVEYLRRQLNGSAARLQRSARVIQRSQS
jgi:hypothetical protein